MGEKIVRSTLFRRQTKECMTVFLFCFFVCLFVFCCCCCFFFSNWVRNVIEKQRERNVKDSSIS